MSFAKIMVPVAGSPRDRIALRLALTAARGFDAHVVALFVRADMRTAIPFGELPLSPDFVQELISVTADAGRQAAEAARATVAEVARDADAPVRETPCPGFGLSLREETGDLSALLGDAARLCDLVVFPPLRENEVGEMPDAFARVLIRAACPALLAPHAQAVTPTRLGKRVAVGWDDGGACARALVTAMPILTRAEAVELICVRAAADPEISTRDALGYLALHGVAASVRVAAPTKCKVAEALLASAHAGGADLLVTGGYGHSRLSEALFGGVTEHVVSHAALPVFMVH